ncbi:two-component system OmpR family sensor kinase [Rhodoblastus acidophilus]|uniref:histidine kinase dimerization/phospho-acceptor domain-containing protein n=1 Tax=Rhodoblastus acidophilus TaxID=1074 RepID=UPI002224A032|nr:histidine kinase dimerization/phospho-acceptor domain-containing protein [Rhodoblastus acidophilus]MCW2285996.1 two-component system OmpR family sensor kinase [Rhodoblastus acidophilus]MCW2334890.1 two-component system OmpR family sensor kinase [Rhodoblastus acidophilus]
MREGWSLRRRLALALTGAVTLLWLAGAAAAGFVLQRETDDLFDGALREVAERVLPLAYAELLARETTEAQRVAPVGKKAEYIAYVVRDGAGKVLLHSTDADLSKFPEHPPSGFFSTQSLRGYSVSGVKGTISVTAAEALDHRRSAVRRSLAALMGPLLAVAPAVLAAVWIFVTLALKPIERFRAELESRGRGNLAPLGDANLPREVAPVAGAVNALMSRLSDALQAERSFAANSAHELRTPIAAALAQAQRLTAELSDEAPRERARAIAAALRRLARLSEKLLQLAKAEGGGLVAPSAKPLAPVLRLVIDEMADHDRDLALDVEDAGPVSDLDPDAFAVLARNLIENAIKHGDPEAAIAIRLTPDRLDVVNRGAVVPPEKLKLLMRPFERGPTRAEGSGLGLAIAASICRGAGLRLELASPAPGAEDGFSACVRFPG